MPDLLNPIRQKDAYLYLWAVANYIKVSKLQETKLNIEAEQKPC